MTAVGDALGGVLEQRFRRFAVCLSMDSSPACPRQADAVEERRHVIFVESKLESGEGQDQLRDYREVLKGLPSSFASRTLAFITKYPAAPSIRKEEPGADGVSFVQTRWSKVYGELRKPTPGKDRALLSEFLGFMEDLNMTSNVSLNELLAGVTFAKARAKFASIVQEAASEIAKLDIQTTGSAINTHLTKWAAIEYWSPRCKGSGIQIGVGIHFDSTDTEGCSSELPVAFVKLYTENKNIGKLYEDPRYHPAFEELIDNHGWKLCEQDPKDLSDYILVKQTQKFMDEARGLAPADLLREFFP